MRRSFCFIIKSLIISSDNYSAEFTFTTEHTKKSRKYFFEYNFVYLH